MPYGREVDVRDLIDFFRSRSNSNSNARGTEKDANNRTHTCTHNRACAHTQVLGQPHSNTLEELIRECQKLKDALDDFEAWNSGRNVTNSSKELDFVMDPFEPSEGWQEQDPEDWKPKHEYGGNRIPIRLQVLSVCHSR